MTIRTTPGPLVLDTGDFQLTFGGATVGLKLTFVQGPMGVLATIVAAEKVGVEWVLQEELMGDFSVDLLKSKGITAWLTDYLLPSFNAWLSKRFAGSPVPVPDWVPEQIVDLDAALRQLKVTVVNGVPQVSI